MSLISVVSPVYKAQHILHELVNRISQAIEEITTNYEIILVDDASPDDSWETIKELAKSHDFVKGIKLSRNFGQHYAITAGLDAANGDWIVVMDCDLQDVPEEIPKLFDKTKEGFDIVLASRKLRKDSLFKRAASWLFYRTLSYLTGTTHDASVANFGIYHKKVISVINSMPESIRYFPTMVKWAGFRSTSISVTHHFRTEGKSTYNIKKLSNLALDIILAYSDKPIRLAIKFGLLISLIATVFIFKTIIQYLSGDILVLGYASLIISVWFLSGAIMVILGIVGLYVGKTFEGVKQRPKYIIDEQV